MNRPTSLWERYKQYYCRPNGVGIGLDVSHMDFDDDFLQRMAEPFSRAFEAMKRLECGDIANPDERRMVGHYWLRSPQLAPNAEIRDDIQRTIAEVRRFAKDVHDGVIAPQRADGFYVVLVVGIGGSALGPQFICDALGTVNDPMIVRFIDNTDPDGIQRMVQELDEALEQTLTIVVSKSGGTVETRNGMLEIAAAYRRTGLDFAKHAVAVTCDGSMLHKQATSEKWIRTFPMWDWVGGRTSVTSAVGLLPTALQGLDIDELLAGAAAMDEATRVADVPRNPAALLAAMWRYSAEVAKRRNLVILPYRDRLLLLSRYLQQLIMESLGKERDRAGQTVHEGLSVFGNKGSTDQHAFVQQLRDGLHDFFVTFIRVMKDRADDSAPFFVEADVDTGDYLHGFLLGTRDALSEKGRESITITLDELNERNLGALIALFERAVGLYAELVNINAYDQPGVEAGKRAAGGIIELQRRVLKALKDSAGKSLTARDLAAQFGGDCDPEKVFHVAEHLAANQRIHRTPGSSEFEATYSLK